MTAWHDPSGGIRLASAGSEHAIRIWDPDAGMLTSTNLSSAGQEVWALCSWHAADGSPRFASADFSGIIQIWDSTTGSPMGRPLVGDVGAVRALTCWQHADGNVRIAAGGDRGIRVWDTDTGASVAGWEIPGGVRTLVCWHTDDGSTRLASGGDDGMVRLWDPYSGLALRTIEVGEVSIWGLSDTPAS